MQRLLYISTARRLLDMAEIDQILRVSRRNNAAVGISGLLVVGGRRFLQVLEGPDAEVARTFARIAADPRHFAVVKLADAPVAERSFGQWSMGHVNGGTAGERGTVDLLVRGIEDPTIRAYFDGFLGVNKAA